jgi:heme-degrading monooxygenase HmoA/N-acetylglutamate synthase-like GNAT family acetyltransferase
MCRALPSSRLTSPHGGKRFSHRDAQSHNPRGAVMYLNAFRHRKCADFDAEAYAADAARMEALARAQKGFISFRRYTANDGESLSISEWETEEDARAWARNPEHEAVQARGRSKYYESYVVYSCIDPNVSYFDRGNASVELRRAVPSDAAAIRDLTREAYGKWVPLIGREPKPMTADYDAAVERHRFDLLLKDGVLAGLLETVDEGEQLLIENVAIAPQFQRQGFGRKLLAHAEAIARDLGRPRVRLYTNQKFTDNLQLYERLGYAVDREEDLGVAVAVHMSKAVNGNIA